MAFFILLAAAAVTSGDEYVTRRYKSRYSPYEFEYTVRRRPSYRDVRHNRKGSLRILFVLFVSLVGQKFRFSDSINLFEQGL